MFGDGFADQMEEIKRLKAVNFRLFLQELRSGEEGSETVCLFDASPT